MTKPKAKALYQILFLILLIIAVDSSICHYSCKNCTTSNYFNCFSCSDTSNSFTITESTSFINSTYLKSIYDVGICVGLVPSGVNALGVLLIMISLLCLIFFRNFHVFYIYCTIQTIGLFSLIQISWLNPANYILQSFQYLMPINLILSSLKIKDYMLLIFGYYRLDQYIIDLSVTLTVIIFVINVIVFSFIIFFWKMSRQQIQQELQQDKQKIQITQSQIFVAKSTQNQLNQKNEVSVFYSYFNNFFPIQQLKKWKTGLHFTLYLFFLLIQETMLTIMVQVVFVTGIFIISLWIIYFFFIFVVLLICFNQWNKQKKQQMKLFLSIPCMIINWFKKIIIPIVVVLPTRFHFIIFIVYPLLAFLQAYFDSKSKKYGCISRMFIYKLIQTVLIVALLIYYFNQTIGQVQSNSLKVAYFVFAISLIFILTLFVEIPLQIIQKIESNQKKPQIQVQKQLEDKLQQQDTIDGNIFYPQKERPTLDIIQLNGQEEQNIINQEKNFKEQKHLEQLKVKSIIELQQQQKKKKELFQQNNQTKQKLQKNVANFISQNESKQNKDLTHHKIQPYQQTKIIQIKQKKGQQKQQQKQKEQIKKQNTSQNQTVHQKPIITQESHLKFNNFTNQTDHQTQLNMVQKNKDEIQQKNQEEEQKEDDEIKKQKRKKRRIIQDPQLRKRYGIK